MTALIKRLSTSDADFSQQFQSVLRPTMEMNTDVENSVKNIVADIRRQQHEAALLNYTQKFDGWQPKSFQDLCVTVQQCQQALASLPQDQQQALQTAAQAIRDYHQRQVQSSWSYQSVAGALLGQQITALDSVGIYVPGGRASYPSSVLMNAIPAKIAGVKNVVMVTPTPQGEMNPLVLAAAAVAGVDQVLRVGGAQAIALLAYGSENFSRVDKIVGPGNAYVAEAKRQVFGQVGIDMIAGPSEILVVCDGKTDPRWVVMDLFSQAEHDVMAQAILICPDENYLTKIENKIAELLPQQPRADIIRQSLQERGALIQSRDLDEAMDLINHIAPEHLALSIEKAENWLPKIRHAGAIFVGPYTAEVFGDYCAGPNHVLPTAGSARFFSPLGVYDFQKRSSLIQCSPKSAAVLANTASVLARSEGLIAHAEAAECRQPK